MSNVRVQISIHTPARGVTILSTLLFAVYCDFNPHSRTGSDLYVCLDGRQQVISIHTPARGVTRTWDSLRWRYANFNPHSRTGSDRVLRLRGSR